MNLRSRGEQGMEQKQYNYLHVYRTCLVIKVFVIYLFLFFSNGYSMLHLKLRVTCMNSLGEKNKKNWNVIIQCETS